MEEIYNGLLMYPHDKPLKFGSSIKSKGKRDRARLKKFAFSSLTGKKKMKGLKEKFANARTRATLRSKTLTGKENFRGSRSFYTRSMEIRKDMNRTGRPLSSQVIVMRNRTNVKIRNLKKKFLKKIFEKNFCLKNF